jgi:O-antigen ligase
MTLFYGLPAGACLGYWSRRKDHGLVLFGYAAICLAVALAANSLIDASAQDQALLQKSDEFVRVNPDDEIEYLKYFAIANVVIGIIPMTLFGLTGTMILLVPGWKWQKLLMVLAGSVGLYANVLVATRTTLLTVVMTFACLAIPVARRNSRGLKRARIALVVAFLAFAGFLMIAALVFASTDRYRVLLDRFSDLSDDPRQYVWQEAAGLLLRNPMGGGILDLKSEAWAHNMFLDFGLTNGFPGLVFMAAAYACIMRLGWRAIRRAGLLHEPLGVALLAAFLASFFVSMTEPPSPTLIAFSYMFATFSLFLIHHRKTSVSVSSFPKHALAPRTTPAPFSGSLQNSI